MAILRKHSTDILHNRNVFNNPGSKQTNEITNRQTKANQILAKGNDTEYTATKLQSKAQIQLYKHVCELLTDIKQTVICYVSKCPLHTTYDR